MWNAVAGGYIVTRIKFHRDILWVTDLCVVSFELVHEIDAGCCSPYYL